MCFCILFLHTGMACLLQKAHNDITSVDIRQMSESGVHQRITHIIDCEAYTYKKKHYLREIAVWCRDTDTICLYHVFMPNELFDCHDRGVQYQIKKVHGLPIQRVRQDRNFYTYYEVMRMLHELFQNADLVGYKGGTIERDLLNNMGVESINLEILGCPKYICLIAEYGLTYEDCGYHLKKGKYHCSAHEVRVFAYFVNNVGL